MVSDWRGPVHRAVRGWRAGSAERPTSRHCSSTGWRSFAALISRQSLPDAIEAAAAAALAALHGVTMGDGALSSWQGGNPGEAGRPCLVEGCGLRASAASPGTRLGLSPHVGARHRAGHRRAPPPPPKMASAGCASTLAFEMSDGSQRLIINCGGPAAPYGPAAGPGRGPSHHGRAQHSHHFDTNSTAILPDGSLGKGGGRPHRAQRGQRL